MIKYLFAIVVVLAAETNVLEAQHPPCVCKQAGPQQQCDHNQRRVIPQDYGTQLTLEPNQCVWDCHCNIEQKCIGAIQADQYGVGEQPGRCQ